MTYFAAPGMKGLKVAKKVDYEKVIKLSADFFNLATQQVLSKSRRMDIVDARRHIMYYLRNERGIMLKKIGVLLAGKDHTTVIHGLTSLRNLCDTEPNKKKILKDYIEYISLNL
jgi:chromosomal replication initiator protein